MDPVGKQPPVASQDVYLSGADRFVYVEADSGECCGCDMLWKCAVGNVGGGDCESVAWNGVCGGF